jgi:DME family drug/metabolite transporter
MVQVALAAATWGTIGVAVDLLYRVSATDAVSVGFWRTALSAPPLLLLNQLYTGPARWQVARRDLVPLAVMGLSFAGYQVCYFAAIHYIGVAAAVLINICSAPLIIALLSSVFLRERVTPLVYAVMAVAVVGATLLVGGSAQAAGPAALLIGAGLALGAGFFYSLVALEARVLAPRYPPVQPLALALTFGAVLLLPFALFNGLDVNYPPTGWLLLLYLGLVPTGIGYIFFLRGMRHTPATVASILVLLEPLISAALAVTFLGERLSPTGALGGALLLGSILFLYLSQSRRPAGSAP